MKIATVAIVAAVALFCCASAGNVTTSLLIPNGLYSRLPIIPQAFLGQMSIARSTTYYTFDCDSGPDAFFPGPDGCDNGNSYTFSAFSSTTQFLLPNYTVPAEFWEGHAPSFLQNFPQTWTVNCGPIFSKILASCLYTYLYNDEMTGDNSIITINPTYTTTTDSAIDSSLYPVTFTSDGGASNTAGPGAAPTASMASSTTKGTTTGSPASKSPTGTAHPALGPSAKVGIALGVPLAACALATLAILLYRHGKHNERSRLTQGEKLSPPPKVFPSPSDGGKRFSDAGAGDQMLLGRQPPVYSMEMQG